MSTGNPNWDNSDDREDARARLVAYFDDLAARHGGESVGVERSPGMEARLADELGMTEGRLQEAIKDALQDGHVEQFAFPETLVTDGGERHEGDRPPILWMCTADVGDPSDPRGDA